MKTRDTILREAEQSEWFGRGFIRGLLSGAFFVLVVTARWWAS